MAYQRGRNRGEREGERTSLTLAKERTNTTCSGVTWQLIGVGEKGGVGAAVGVRATGVPERGGDP